MARVLPPRRAVAAGELGVLLCLAALAALAWFELARLAEVMSMPGMDEADMPAMPWSAADFGLRLAMWVTMMVGMMLPSAAPMILLVRRVVAAQPHAAARVALFVLPYLVVWAVFSVAATALQQALEAAAWVTPMSMRAAPWLSGGILVAAGLYQWSAPKRACLEHCRSPIAFLMRHSLATWRDAGRLGLSHGLYCLGCCWALMAVLFAVGVMNLLAAAALAGFVLAEKVSSGPWLPRLAGALLVAWGLAVWTSVGSPELVPAWLPGLAAMPRG